MASTAGYRQSKPKQGQQQNNGSQSGNTSHTQGQNQSQNHTQNQNQSQAQKPKNKWNNSSNNQGGQAPRSFSNVVGNAANQQPPPSTNTKQQQQTHNRSPSTNHQPSHTSNGVSSPPQQGRMDIATSHHMHDRFLYLLACLVGHQITVTVKGGTKYTGVFSSAATEGEFGVVLKHARKEFNNEAAKTSNSKSNTNPFISTIIIPSKDLVDVQAEDIDLYAVDAVPNKGDTFRTDAEISGRNDNQQRELRRWTPDDAETFGNGINAGLDSKSTGTWDQFAVNEKLFGTKTDYDEDLYTTKLNKDRPDFAELEKRAARIAREIETSTVSNPHMAEERNIAVDDSGLDEEERYGAVVRGPNAYTPPAARKDKLGPQQSAKEVSTLDASDTDMAVLQAPLQSATLPPTIDDENGTRGVDDSQAEPAIVSTFRQWVGDEKQKYMVKKQALAKKEKDGRLADLLKFSQSFKLKTPVPQDLVPILAKDKEKQEEIVQKAKSSVSPKPEGKTLEATSSSSLQESGNKSSATVKLPAAAAAVPSVPKPTTPIASLAAKPPTTSTSPPNPNAQSFKLNIKASSFKPNPKAATFAPSPLSADKKPQTPPTTSSTPPATAPLNPFFGSNVPRKTDATLRDGFDPIRRNRHTPNPKNTQPTWPIGNKSFRAQYTFNQAAVHAMYNGDDDQNATAPPLMQQQAAAAAAAMAHQAATPGHQYAMQYAYAPYGPRAGGFPATAAGGFAHIPPMAMNQAGMPYMNSAFMPGMPFSPPIPGAPPFMYSPGAHPRPPPGTSNVTAVPYYSMMPSGSPIPAAANLMPPRPMMMMGGTATPPPTITGAASPQADTSATSSPAPNES